MTPTPYTLHPTPKTILYNSIKFRLVPYHGQETHPDTGIAFYVNSGHGGVQGLQLLPNGVKRLQNATLMKDGGKSGHGKNKYNNFRDAWGKHKQALASHAVYIAWRERPIPPRMTIDHINGCTTDNRFENLRCITGAINTRDGGFLRKLRHKGINPVTIPRWILLRYYTRMALYKATHTQYQYRTLSRDALLHLLFDPDS